MNLSILRFEINEINERLLYNWKIFHADKSFIESYSDEQFATNWKKHKNVSSNIPILIQYNYNT